MQRKPFRINPQVKITAGFNKKLTKVKKNKYEKRLIYLKINSKKKHAKYKITSILHVGMYYISHDLPIRFWIYYMRNKLESEIAVKYFNGNKRILKFEKHEIITYFC